MVLIDYAPKPKAERPWGPPEGDQCSKASVDADMAAAGLEPEEVLGVLPEQYFVIYEVK